MPDNKKHDVLIIGAGVLGLSTAIALHRKDKSLKIAVAGPKEHHGGATEAAGAMLGCYGEVTAHLMASPYGRKKLALSIEAKQKWDEWVSYLNEHTHTPPLEIDYGTSIVLNARSGAFDVKNFNAILKTLEAHQEPYSVINGEEILGYKPSGDSTAIQAIHLPQEGAIDVLALRQKLLDYIAQATNITFSDTYVSHLAYDKQKVFGGNLFSGELLEAGQTLVAAGAFSQQLLSPLQLPIPMLVAGVGCALLLKSEGFQCQGVIRTPNRSGACGIHALLRDSQELYIGATSYFETTPALLPRLKEAYYLQQYAIEQINTDLYDAQIAQVLVGNRPVCIDTFPLVGKTKLPGLWLLTGTFRDGLHQSPVLGSMLAEGLLSNTDESDNLFAPQRLPIQAMSENETINSAIEQLIGASYEHSIKLPLTGWHGRHEALAREMIVSTYEALDSPIIPPPEILLMLLRKGEETIQEFKAYYQWLHKMHKSA